MDAPHATGKELAEIREMAERGEIASSIRGLRDLLEAPKNLTTHQIALGHELLARCELSSDRKPAAMQYFRIASGLFREAGDEQRALYCGLITISTDPQARKDGLFRQRLTAAQAQVAVNDWPNLNCLCSLFEADFAAEAGEMSRAIELCESAVCTGDEYRLGWENHTMFLRLGRFYAASGDLSKAVSLVRKAFNLAQQAEIPWAQRNVLFFLSYLAWMQRDFVECIRCNRVIVDSVDQSSQGVAVEGVRLINAYRNIAQAYIQLGDYSRALENTQQALVHSQQFGVSDNLARCYAVLATIRLLDGDPKTALEDTLRVEKLVTEDSVDIEIVSTYYINAVAMLALGRIDEAIASWDKRPEIPSNSEAKMETELIIRGLDFIAQGRFTTSGEQAIRLAGEWLGELTDPS